MQPTPASQPRQPISKPAKPYKDFPLFIHQSGGGRWCKKIRQRFVYFGKVADDPDGQRALGLWLDQQDALLAGRRPKPKLIGDDVTVREAVNAFLTAKRQQVDAGELTERSFRDYHTTAGKIIEVFGRDRLVKDLNGPDFEKLRAQLAKRNGPVRLGNEVQRVRTLFRYGAESGLLDQPVKFGATFKRPARRVIRRLRSQAGEKMFDPAELRAMIDAAGQPLKAMILLGVNCGLGNADVGSLPIRAIDLAGGWIDFPRPKTGIPRRCLLWPETIASLREWVARRPEPKDPAHANLVFLTKRRGPWANDTPSSPVAHETRKLLDRLGLHKPGLGFYGLRRTFRTIADETLDAPAIDYVMGHTRDDMASHYRERISDDRLRRVAEHVRRWLYGDRVDQGQGDDVAILRIC